MVKICYMPCSNQLKDKHLEIVGIIIKDFVKPCSLLKLT